MKLIPTVASKGGVGKSLISINTAYALKELGYNSGLLDLDLTMPAVVKYLGLEGRDPGTGRMLEPIEYNGIEILSAGLSMDPDQPVTIPAETRRKLVNQFISKTLWKADYLVIDTPPGSNEELMEIIDKYKQDILGFIVVTTPSSTAITEVRRSLELLKRRNLPVIGIIGNMVGFECLSCHTVNSIFNNGHANPIEQLAEDFNTSILTSLPMYPNTDTDPLHFIYSITEGLRTTELF